jgi:hypothetical protein
MSFIKPTLTKQKTAEDVLFVLAHNGIYCRRTPQNGSWALDHNKTKEEFHQLMIDLCASFGLEAQDDKWFPGSPGGTIDDVDSEDYGYYVCPTEYIDDDNEDLTKFDYDFYMLITTNEVTWC